MTDKARAEAEKSESAEAVIGNRCKKRSLSKDDIGKPENFQHIIHLGHGENIGKEELIRLAEECMVAEEEKKDAKRRHLDIRSPEEVRHVTHIGEGSDSQLEMWTTDQLDSTKQKIFNMAQVIHQEQIESKLETEDKPDER